METADDSADEEHETFTLTLSNPAGATLEDAEATGTIADDDEALAALTTAFHGMPAEHDGGRLFSFEIRFSEEFEGLRLTALEAGAQEVTGGRLVDVKRTTRGENRSVTARVRPASSADVTVSLAATTDCSASTAICTRDGRMLSNSPSATVSRSANTAARRRRRPPTHRQRAPPPSSWTRRPRPPGRPPKTATAGPQRLRAELASLKARIRGSGRRTCPILKTRDSHPTDGRRWMH